MTKTELINDVRTWLNRFKNYRDGLMVAIGVSYIVGYGVWPLYAVWHHLGLFPALQAQSFIHGIVPAVGTSGSRSAAEALLKTRLKKARYMSECCDPIPIINWPGYEGRSVRRCGYSLTSNNKTLSAIVYLLNPSADNIADRIGNACAAIGLGEKRSCGLGLATWIMEKNGGQFPVAGFVIEKKMDAGGKGPDPVYLEFRDGTTVESADKLNFTDRQLTMEAMEHAARAPVSGTRVYARIANATREDYYRAGGTESVGIDPTTDKERRWPAVVRANELRAQDTGLDDLLRGVAIRMRDTLAR